MKPNPVNFRLRKDFDQDLIKIWEQMPDTTDRSNLIRAALRFYFTHRENFLQYKELLELWGRLPAGVDRLAYLRQAVHFYQQAQKAAPVTRSQTPTPGGGIRVHFK